jgi:hypothetical protein
MDDAQFKQFLEANERATSEAIEKFVNGKIRVLDQKLTDHMENEEAFRQEIQPFLQGAQGLKVIRNFLYWVGGLFVVWIAFRNSIKF